MRALGSAAPTFSLTDVVSGGPVASADFTGRPLLAMFICNHCPFVVHVRSGLVALAHEALELGVGVIAINANDAEGYPQDAPGPMADLARAEGWRFPYCFDETQAVARAFGAACTPDFFLFDGAHALAYRGQMDGARPGNGVPVTGSDLRAAIAAVVAGQPVSAEQRPSLGCNIKWRAE